MNRPFPDRERSAIDSHRSHPSHIAAIVIFLAALSVPVGCEKSDSQETQPREKTEGSEPDEESDDSASHGNAESGETTPKKSAGGRAKPVLKPGTPRQKKLLSKAKKSFLVDDLEKAEPRFEKVIDTGPMTGTKASAYVALAQIYIQSNRPQEAIDLLNTMPEPGDEVVEARMVLARAYASADENKEAIDEYEAVIELQPNYIFVYPTLGGLYNEVGEKKKAAKLFLRYENKLESLSSALENPDSATLTNRINILDIFSAVRDERAVDAVEASLEDPSARVRSKAAKTAADIEAVSLKSTLKKMAKEDSNEHVRRAVKAALQRLETVEMPPDRPDGKEDFGRQ